MDSVAIRDLLPHRYPLLLVDAVRELVAGERIVAVKAITVNEPWYARVPADAQPTDFAYPSPLLLESWAQSAGILVGSGPEGIGGGVLLFGSAGNVEYGARVYPGQVLEHHVRLGKRFADSVLVSGETVVDGEVVVTVEQGLMAFRPADSLQPRT